MGHPTPFQVQKYLGGLRYPAGRDAVLEHARVRGADTQVMQLLVLLPDGAYESPIAVSREIGRQTENRLNA